MANALRRCLSTTSIFSTFRKQNPALSQSLPKYYSNGRPQLQETVSDFSKIENEMSKKVFEKVNQQISNKSHGRLFAVVQVQSTQYKITTDDIIAVRHHWPPTLGDRIRLEKVLLVGCSDFTLIGTPLLPLDQVTVTASVIEKTLTQTINHLKYLPRKNNMKHSLFKDSLTLLRINSIILTGLVNELGDTDGLVNRIF